MELSQTALAILFLYGLPLGGIFSLLYRITDLEGLNTNTFKSILTQIKDFLFVVLAGIAIVIFVYYANEGDFRYLALVGAVIGFALFDMLIGKPIVKLRNALLGSLYFLIRIPVYYMYGKTIGRLKFKIENKSVFKHTQHRIKEMVLQASDGFECITEAKEWKKRGSIRMQQ
jgi:hypothetical protein